MNRFSFYILDTNLLKKNFSQHTKWYQKILAKSFCMGTLLEYKRNIKHKIVLTPNKAQQVFKALPPITNSNL